MEGTIEHSEIAVSLKRMSAVRLVFGGEAIKIHCRQGTNVLSDFIYNPELCTI